VKNHGNLGVVLSFADLERKKRMYVGPGQSKEKKTKKRMSEGSVVLKIKTKGDLCAFIYTC